MTNNSASKKLLKALRRLFCFSLLCALPATSLAQEQHKPQVRQSSAKSDSRASGQNTAGQNSSGPQWMKSAHRGWVAVPTGAKPPASIRLASLKAQEDPANSSTDKAPTTPAPESQPQQAPASDSGTASAPPESSRELTAPQVATPPAEATSTPLTIPSDGAAPAEPAKAAATPSGTTTPSAAVPNPQQTRESLSDIREKMRQSILNRPDKAPVASPKSASPDASGRSSSRGLSDLLMEDLTSDDEIRRQRAQEFQKVQDRLKLLLEQEKQRQARQALAVQPPVTPPVTPPAPNPVVPDKPPVTPDPHPMPGPVHPEPGPVHPVPEPVHPEPDQHPSPDPNRHQDRDQHVDPHDSKTSPVHDDRKTDGGEEHSGHGPHVEIPTVPAKTTVDGTIDHLGLANNLFAVGQFELSLEIYQKVDPSTVSPQQQFWVEYQQASCLRRLGRSAEASNKYRRLADKPEAGSLSELARWWVTTLEHKRQLEKKLAEQPGHSNEEHAPATDHHDDAHTPSAPLKSTPREHVAAPKASSDSGHSSGH